MSQQPNGWIGGGWCLLGIYVPAALLVFGSLPYWEFLRREPTSRALLKGANASVVGLLLAALYQPLWTTTVHHPIDFCIAMAAYLLIEIWKIPPWIVVGLSALAGALLYSGLAAAD
jgi:chromate transporter